MENVFLCLALLFPSVTGQNLNGDARRLPTDFKAPASLVFVAYKREQQREVDTWQPLVSELRQRVPALAAYELPTLSRGNALFRGFIDGGMRRGISDPAVRASTITLYIDKGPFNEALHIASEDQITVLLVKPDGTVLWRSGGAYDASKRQGLDDALKDLASVSAPPHI